MRKCDFIQNKIHIKDEKHTKIDENKNKNKTTNKTHIITINDIFIESALAERELWMESVHTSIYLT